MGFSQAQCHSKGSSSDQPAKPCTSRQQRQPATRSQHFACTIRLEAAVRHPSLGGSSPAFSGSLKRPPSPPLPSPRLIFRPGPRGPDKGRWVRWTLVGCVCVRMCMHIASSSPDHRDPPTSTSTQDVNVSLRHVLSLASEVDPGTPYLYLVQPVSSAKRVFVYQTSALFVCRRPYHLIHLVGKQITANVCKCRATPRRRWHLGVPYPWPR